ncbi:hypothetical protein ACWGAN_04365 [Streptomyces sp. NPDC054945]
MSVIVNVICWPLTSPGACAVTFLGLFVLAHLCQDWPDFLSDRRLQERRAAKTAARRAVKDAEGRAAFRASEARSVEAREIAEAERLTRHRLAEAHCSVEDTTEAARRFTVLYLAAKKRRRDRGGK